MRILKNLFLLAILLSTIISCSGGSDGPMDENGSGEEEKTPTLIFPLDDSECFEGTVLSETRSEVKFEWNATSTAKSYILNIKNLNTNKESGFNSDTTFKTVSIERGVPYSWNVIAIGERFSDQNKSLTWNFYNAGLGDQNYAPFPAKPVFPTRGSKAPRNFKLSWISNDLDGDIKEYDIYLGTNNPPAKLETTLTSELTINNLNADTVYYWYIVTKDEHGNKSTSPIFDFKTE